MPRSTDGHGTIPLWCRRRYILFSFALLTSAVVGSGCSSMGRRVVSDEEVLASRRLTQQGIDAMHRGRLDDAERVLSDAIASAPLDQNTRYHYAELQWKQGNQAAAVAEMEEALRLSGGDNRMFVRLGQMYLESGRPEPALAQAERAIEAGVDPAAAWALCGDVYLQQDNIEEALASYYRSLSHQANQPPVELAVAEIHRRQNRPQRALSTLQHLTEQYPTGQEPAECLLQQGLALSALGRFDTSIAILERASVRDPARADIFYHLAAAQMLGGNLADARAAAQQALARNPEDPTLRDMVARCEQLQQRMASQATP